MSKREPTNRPAVRGAFVRAGRSALAIATCVLSAASCGGEKPPQGEQEPLGSITEAIQTHTPHTAKFACNTCHFNIHGDPYGFNPNSPAAGTVFNSVTKTCTGGCHSDAAGGPPGAVPVWTSDNLPSTFPTTTCSTYNNTCGTCNALGMTGQYCCNCHAADNSNPYLLQPTGDHRMHVSNQRIRCGTCHPDPSGSTHVNGTKDLTRIVVQGSGDNTETITQYQKPELAPAPYANVCTGKVTCVGVCHGQPHFPQYPFSPGCW